MSDLETRTPRDLPRAAMISPNALTTVQEDVPGAPVLSLPLKDLFGRLVQTSEATATEADLQALLAYDANSIALVFADPDPLKNGWYRKVGATGAGNWSMFERLGAAEAAEAAAELAENAAASAANFADNLVGLFPDPYFATSAALGRGLTLNGKDYLAASQPFKVWDADFSHAFGTGAYRIEGNGDIAAWRTWFNSPQAASSGVAADSTLTVIMLAQAAAASSIAVAARFINDAGGYVGNQVGTKIFVATGGLQAVWSDPITVPAGAVGVEMWLWNGTADTHIVDVDCAVGDNHEPLRRLKWQGAPMRNVPRDLANVEELTGWAVASTRVIEPIERLDSIATSVTATVARTEGDGFTGFGAAYTTPGTFSANAFYFQAAARGATTKKWSRIDFVLKTAATNPNAGTIKAVGSIPVDPENGLLTDVYALMRHPTTNVPLTLTAADLDGQYAVHYKAFTSDGSGATMGEAIGTVAGATQIGSFYVTNAPLSSAWATYSGNPVMPIAAVQLDNPEEITRLSLSAQAKASLGINGLGVVPETANLGRLRRTRSKLVARKNGEATQLKIAFKGDSFSTTSAYYIANLAKLLIAVAGDGGVGFWGMGFPSTDSFGGDARGLYYGTTTGTWTSNYHAGSTAPNISDARSSVAGSTFLIRSISGATHPALSAVKLHYTPTADGVIRWRWNGGAWSANTNVQSGNVLDLTGFPTAALNVAVGNAITLEIEVISGLVILVGADFQSATSGVVLHKLGSSGSQAGQWATASASANWRASIAALAPDLVTYMTGPNDQAADIPAATVRANAQTLIASAKAAVPGVDVLLVAPPETPAGALEAIPMADYTAALYDASVNAKAAWLDLQPAFGDADNTAEYASDGAVPLFLPDGVHPSMRGANVIAGEYARAILGGL